MKKQILSLAFVSLSIFLSAQESENIEEVHIQGKFLNLPYKKVNENITLITKSEIQNSPSQSIDEILQQYAGMDIRRRGSNGVQSDVSVRGGSFEQVLIFLNGIRMNDSQTGHNSLNIPVDLSNVERIEIVKGPSARRFGNGAYAAINIITKTFSEENVKISAEGGDYQTYNLGLSSNFGNEKFSGLFSVNSGASEGYRHNTDYKINNIFYQNQFKLTNGKIQFQAGFSEKKFGANGFYASPLATEQYEETQASVVSVMHSQAFGKFNLNSNIFWRRGQDMYLYNREKPEIYRNMHIGNNVGGEINGSYTSNLGTTGLGVELRKEFLVSNNLGDRERFITQLFFEHHFSFIDNKLQVSPGISWANFSNSGDFFYPGIDVGYDFNNQHKIYGNVAKVHRVPTFTDLYYVSRTEQGNANLNPESAVSYELGYRFLKKGLTAKASLFGRNSEDEIDWVKNSAEEKWAAQNIGKVETKGFETEINQNFEGFLKSYSIGYTFTENKLKTESAFTRYALDQLKHQFIAKIENRFLKNFTNELSYRYQERATGYSYNLLDEKLSFHQNNLELFVLINNLTNTNYTETFGVPMPKRWFHVGFSYQLGL
ncbi:TonB-dependent siderophore receptor [uncultured Chryseobacterium sp.]|uniref:TonB-dependent receptor plug domain-containing protein n=1 Tax=uncultured Chryseobacterium sp. TaxID=259322 RepID=UPI0026053D01|nr:TonB-dependent receptor [uncultured Chryseobacterium sp.]